MKICYLLLTVWILAIGAMADEIRLKDGSLLRGEMITIVPDQKYIIRLKDGSEVVYIADKVESVNLDSKEQVRRNNSGQDATIVNNISRNSSSKQNNRGLSIGNNLGGMIYDSGKGTGFGGDIRVVYDKGPHEMALSVGGWYGEQSDYDEPDVGLLVPVKLHYAHLLRRHDQNGAIVQPYVGLAAGVLIANDNWYKGTYALFSPEVGVEFYLGRHFVLGLGLSYDFVDYQNSSDNGWVANHNADLSQIFSVMISVRPRIPIF